MHNPYKTPPLIEASCEMFFETLEWDITYPADFFNLIKANFSIKKQ